MNVEQFKASDKMPLIVVLDDVRSMYNVGSVFRTADAFRVEAIYLCGITACPPHPEIHKTALGAEDTVEWRYFADTMDAVRQLHEDGYTVMATEQCEGSTMLQDWRAERSETDHTQTHALAPSRNLEISTPRPHKHKYAIIMGNEVKGVRQDIVDASDACLEIPQYGTKHSLNVSTTAGIVIWEFAKQLIIE